MKETAKIEKLNLLRNEMSHLWGSVFIVGGGSFTFVINEPSLIKYIIGFIGIIFALLFLNAYFIRRTEVFKLIQSLEAENES